MPRFVCLLTVAAFAASAQAALLELWFSTNSSTVAPPVPEVPVLPVGYSGKVYLWARSAGSWQTVNTLYSDANGAHPWTFIDWVGDVWQGISVDSATTIGFNGTIVNPNATAGHWARARWLADSDFTWANANQFNAAALASERGCGGAARPLPPGSGPSVFDSQQKPEARLVPGQQGHLYTRLGSITITSAPAGATFFMVVGTGTIARRGGDPANDRVIFGVEPPWMGIPGGIPGGRCEHADLIIAPEPGSLVLAGVAMLALRRRTR